MLSPPRKFLSFTRYRRQKSYACAPSWRRGNYSSGHHARQEHDSRPQCSQSHQIRLRSHDDQLFTQYYASHITAGILKPSTTRRLSTTLECRSLSAANARVSSMNKKKKRFLSIVALLIILCSPLYDWIPPWPKTITLGIFAVADVYTLYTETTDPLNIWGKKCVFSNLSEYISLEKLCATTPLYSRLSGLPSPSPAERLEKEHEELFKALYAPSLRLRAPLPRIRNTPDASIINCHLPAGPTISLRAELPGAENEDCRLWLWWEFTNPYSKSREREGVLVASLLPLSTSAETRDFQITLKLPSSLLSDLDVQPLHYVYEVRNPALGSLSYRRATFTGPVEN